MISDIPPTNYNFLNFYSIEVKEYSPWSPVAWVQILDLAYTRWDLRQLFSVCLATGAGRAKIYMCVFILIYISISISISIYMFTTRGLHQHHAFHSNTIGFILAFTLSHLHTPSPMWDGCVSWSSIYYLLIFSMLAYVDNLWTLPGSHVM